MKHRDYLWCALNLLLDGEDELAALCPACRAEALEKRCPVCGAVPNDCGQNSSFDEMKFQALRGVDNT